MSAQNEPRKMYLARHLIEQGDEFLARFLDGLEQDAKRLQDENARLQRIEAAARDYYLGVGSIDALAAALERKP